MKMKRLFTGLLVGALAVGGQMTVFAATGEQKAEKLVPATIAIKNIGEQKIKNEVAEGVMTVAIDTVEAINIEDMTPEQKTEFEKVQKEYEEAQKELENKIKVACEKNGYDFEDIMGRLKIGNLSEEEYKALEEAGVIYAVAVDTVEAINIEDMTPEQKAEFEKLQKEFDNRLEKVVSTTYTEDAHMNVRLELIQR